MKCPAGGIIDAVEREDQPGAAGRQVPDGRGLVRATVARALRSTARSDALPPADLAELGRLLQAERTVSGTLGRVVKLAPRAVPGCRHASVTMPEPATVAATDAVARRLDSLQYVLGEGPCLAALASTTPVLCTDLSQEERWPEFAAVAVRSGVVGVLCCRLTLGGAALGSLNLYAAAASTFGSRDVPLATAYAAHAASALARVAEREQVVQLHRAFASDRMIATAIGLLMGTRRISEAEAFDLLRVFSQHTNRKLRDVATEVVQHGGTLT